MSTRASTKPARPPAKSTGKTLVKDQTKSDKQPTNVLEIIPGKFNETDWLALLESDDTEDYIADIFDDIWIQAEKQIQQIYIRKQLLPFTLMMTENALSSVIQWAFLERDEPKPINGVFWTEDSEPTPCNIDNWGEGVVPACREDGPQSIQEFPISVAEHSSSAPLNTQTPDDIDQILSGSSSSSSSSSIRSSAQTKQLDKINETDDHTLPEKDSSTEQNTNRSSIEQKPYNHDMLVIQTQPPKLETLSDLFIPSRMHTNSSSLNPTPVTITSKRRRMIAPKASSQLGSDTLASMTNITDTTTTKSLKKIESKLFDDQHIEEIISKAPAAAHSMLKSILSRPPGYRELELDDYGNVIAITKLDPDKLAPRSIRVKCDVVKPRKVAVDTRPSLKQAQQMRLTQSYPKYVPVKLALPEQSTDVGDLIQPAPGVLYEDSKSKKGDPRRYKDGMAKYTNFYDETRPLRPIARQGDFTMRETANDLLGKSRDYDDNEREPQIPKLHRLARIPPIMSGSSTSSA